MDLSALDKQLASLSEDEFLALPTVKNWLQRNVSVFRIDALPDEFVDDPNMEMTNFLLEVIRRDDGRWGVKARQDKLLQADGQWTEGRVSYEQLDTVRFPLLEAIALARRAAPLMRTMDMSVDEYVMWLVKRYAERS